MGFRRDTKTSRTARRTPARAARPPGDGTARERILAAALTAFAERGFDGVSVTAVARAAGVTQPLVHYHFASKEALWHAVVDQAFGDLRTAFATALDEVRGLEPAEVVRLLVRRFVLFSGRHRGVCLIMVREGFEAGARLDWLVRRHLRPLLALVKPVGADGIRRGKLKPLPFPNVAHTLIGAVAAFFGSGPMIQRLHGIDPTAPAEVSRHADVVVEILLHGVLPSAKSPGGSR